VVFIAKKSLNPNAVEALAQLKMEIARELGVDNKIENNNSISNINNIFTAGPVGGVMTRRLVEMGEKQLIDNQENK